MYCNYWPFQIQSHLAELGTRCSSSEDVQVTPDVIWSSPVTCCKIEVCACVGDLTRLDCLENRCLLHQLIGKPCLNIERTSHDQDDKWSNGIKCLVKRIFFP